jgi:3-hydroxyacyl-[acyl-carrier-protein] dehydratase
MPGVLILEALAQAGAILLIQELPERDGKLFLFTGIDDARFRRPVVPGDQLRLTVDLLQRRSRSCRMRGVAEVDGSRAAEAELRCAMVDRE